MSDLFDVGHVRLKRDLGLGIMHARTDGITTDAQLADYLSGWLGFYVNAAVYHGKSRVQEKVLDLLDEHADCGDGYCPIIEDLETMADGF